MLSLTGDGDKINITVGFTAPNAASTESLKLMFDLDGHLSSRKILCCLLMREWWRFG